MRGHHHGLTGNGTERIAGKYLDIEASFANFGTKAA